MACRLRKLFAWWLLLGAIALGILLGLGGLNPPPAAAAIRQLEESPGQIVYQARQTLQDQQGNRWQTIAFKRIRPDGQTSFELRLVGFPGSEAIEHNLPLTLTNALGTTLTAKDTSGEIFTAAANPEPPVGQYDLQPLLPQLQPEIPLQITLPTIEGKGILLGIPAAVVQEWQTVARSG